MALKAKSGMDCLDQDGQDRSVPEMLLWAKLMRLSGKLCCVIADTQPTGRGEWGLP